MQTKTDKIRVALTGGGSGGHTYPLVAVMEAMQEYIRQGRDIEFHYFGTRDSWSEEVIAHGAVYHHVSAGKFRRYISILNIIDIPKIAWSFVQTFWKMFWLMPDVLFSKGGPGAWPVVVAAWFYRVPIIVHESDASPGLANLLSAPFAKKIAVGFEAAQRYFNPKKTVVSGNPVRPSLMSERQEERSAKEALGFSANLPLLVVMGGSQGAKAINEFIILHLRELLPLVQIYHQTGKANFEEVEKLSRAALIDIPVAVEKQSRYTPVAYLDDHAAGLALSAAEIVLSRAGAGSITEFTAFGKPMILIPLSGHQETNAAAAAQEGIAHIIEETNLTPSIFIATLKAMLEPETRKRMSEAALGVYKPNAAKDLAELILNLV